MADADPTIQYATIWSHSPNFVTPAPDGQQPWKFDNRFEVPMQFNGPNVQVALHSMSYQINHGGTHDATVGIFSDVVTPSVNLGGLPTSLLRVASLFEQSTISGTDYGEVMPRKYQWVDAAVGDGYLNTVAIEIALLPPNATTGGTDFATFLEGQTTVTLAFRTLDSPSSGA
jgi:hypothetical protein